MFDPPPEKMSVLRHTHLIVSVFHIRRVADKSIK